MYKLLVVEDHPELRESIVALLEPEYDVTGVGDGEEGLFEAENGQYDLLVLDVMLPSRDGFSIVRTIRQHAVQTPVLFLTAKDSLADRVQGLEDGGDDYLVKPFEPDELIVRVKALLRRTYHQSQHAHETIGPFAIHAAERVIRVNAEPLPLTNKQYDVLVYLLEHPDRILTKEQIYDRIWGFESETTVTIVEVAIHHLRRKLEEIEGAPVIATVRGVGYRVIWP